LLLSRFGDKVLPNKVVVQCDAEARPVGNADPAGVGLHALGRQIVTQRRILDAVLEQEGIAARAEPVQAGGDGDRTGIAVIAEPGPDLFDAGANVSRVGEAAPREIDLVDIESPG
jgi:hypothetical protein